MCCALSRTLFSTSIHRRSIQSPAAAADLTVSWLGQWGWRGQRGNTRKDRKEGFSAKDKTRMRAVPEFSDPVFAQSRPLRCRIPTRIS